MVAIDEQSPFRVGARRVALASLTVSAVLALTKLVVGLTAGSLAVLSDAVQASLDVGTTGVTWFAVRLADKPPDREHPFGHGRAENLAALGQAGLLLGLGGLVGFEALRRLTGGARPDPEPYVLWVVAVSIAVDVARSRFLRRAAARYASQALEADSLNFTADVLGSVAVLAGLAAVRLGFPAGDPAAALVVVALVVAMGVRLGAAAASVLMDRAPEGLADRLRDAASAVEGVSGVGAVRVRRSGPHALAEITVQVPRTQSVERSHDISRAIQRAIADEVPGTTTVVHVAPSQEGEDVVRRVFAAANRLGLADQVHNVLSIRHPEGLWLMLHAKVDAEMPLARAHEVTDLLERELRAEFGALARVEIHLEPREPSSLLGRVVTLERDALALEVKAIAERHPPIERCHEVAVTDVSGALHVVLHCEAAAHRSIAEIHDASLKVEDEIHRNFSEIAVVTVHFEPSAS